jgi:hypothetical protein
MMCEIGFGTFGIVGVLTRGRQKKFHSDLKVVRRILEEVLEQQRLNKISN